MRRLSNSVHILTQQAVTLVDLGMPALPLVYRKGSAGYRYLGLDDIKNPACHPYQPLLEQAHALIGQSVR